ncbi:hypothetical protein EMIHUDRAFT_438783 [Emiliania huxleyi CCMP1516]|uniref:Fork-head domain-containing protein n=2 Tax=Emiliania huxleyi TaxID=2903 RepID=A0A0D3I4F8_EMIH1|nr:hypothetical protein EMIHUDRAFT_438783 [Emiliania huxleyi CCMP1516]EOD06143.1 hypothetical protein EMIHUDRAFT_438783 [Emiliania huxleyi CCMP1516]|eukprot:XP_005758572.1 hypothetical protein EMIHUDRAFT_438783 [Emiliania huxleyi CCMP1516]
MTSAATSVCDFRKLPRPALNRLAAHYGLTPESSLASSSLAVAVSEAFACEAVDEEQVLLGLLRHDASRGRRGSSNGRLEKRATTAAARGGKPSGARGVGAPNGHASATPRNSKRARGMTYGDMISAALKALPSRRGTLEDIYSVIEEEFSAQLNTELEAGPRQVPVWKASVRKIINLNSVRFHRTSATDASGHTIFELAKGAS